MRADNSALPLLRALGWVDPVSGAGALDGANSSEGGALTHDIWIVLRGDEDNQSDHCHERITEAVIVHPCLARCYVVSGELLYIIITPRFRAIRVPIVPTQTEWILVHIPADVLNAVVR